MEKFIYYQIEGFLPSSFVDHKLGHVKRYAGKKRAINVLEKVLQDWKGSDSFRCNGELVNDNIYQDTILETYSHQFVFKQKRTGMFYTITFKVVKHMIAYEL